MNKIVKLFFICSTLSCAALITSCATLTSDINTETHTDPNVNFENYKTYDWLDNAQIVFDPIGQWEQPTLDTDEEVKFNINMQLRKNGLYEASIEPDLLVAFAAGIEVADLKLKQDPASKNDALKQATRASLIIAMIDAKTGYTVWLGFAEGEVQEQQSIDTIRTRIHYAITELFKSFSR
jgi:hypothetical protein